MVYLFNLLGYTLLFEYIEERSDRQLVQKLDENRYSEDQLIEIKIPLSLPYGTDWPDYRREDGEVEIDGKIFSFVKKKISNDTVYLKCLPNTAKDQLTLARHDYNRKANDLPTGEAGGSLLKKATGLFSYSLQLTSFDLTTPVILVCREYALFSNHPCTASTDEILRPPIA
ncbi:hypothetical protein KJS94_14270 [Flavihumibacter rivuli]|uniref:hypothetical protein n=1 Tax=Flavihumibacter rivuli TaxID=2838156 RepID=UPI001BDF08A5|nr:hypothetical protein [Flavihumibacter rivuli]ULQ55811.1 hypothetical protein KJS94_14270 [Flavihumibacter rivuli]